jgi:hypothetical protein
LIIPTRPPGPRRQTTNRSGPGLPPNVDR